jgi:hypothetical protein
MTTLILKHASASRPSGEWSDLEEVERRVREAGLVIEYGPTSEPWGVRRFYVRDPLGRLVNILTHG